MARQMYRVIAWSNKNKMDSPADTVRLWLRTETGVTQMMSTFRLQRLRSISISLALLLLIAARGLAVCPEDVSGEIFCDDFDRYCRDAPPAPQKCPPDASEGVGALRKVWKRVSTNDANGRLCGTEMNVEKSEFVGSSPFGGRYPCQVDANLGQETVNDPVHNRPDLTMRIKQALGESYDAVAGTDEHPLVMRFHQNGLTGEKIHSANAYMELALGADFAPTDYVWYPSATETCQAVCGGNGAAVRFPVICAQEQAVPGCPPMPADPGDPFAPPIRASIAVGVLAFLDNQPCHCDDLTRQKPRATRLAYYDGYKWRTLRSGLFPGQGDFLVREGMSLVTLTVKSSTVKIEFRTQAPDPDEYSWCEAPRVYAGPFNKVRAGFAKACELTPLSQCVQPRRCIRGAPGAGAVVYDDFVLYGGEGRALPTKGACCRGDGTCSEVSETECKPPDGRWRGAGTTCEATVCCPYPFADADHDEDVDQDDFGRFQSCFTGPGGRAASGCECFDRDSDDDIDQDDFVMFSNCGTGYLIPFDAAHPPPACMP